MDKDGYFVGQYAYSLVIAYNTRNVAPNRAPTAYHDLLNPEWKGQMALDIESYDWLAGMMDILGEETALAFARKLALQNIRLQRGHSMLTQLIAAGELKVMVDGYHYQILTLRQKGAPLDFTVPDPMIIKEPSGIWISRRAAHPHAATLLVDFLFSQEGQQYHARQFFLAARKDINWDFGGKTIRGIRFLSAEKWGERCSEIIDNLTTFFVKRLTSSKASARLRARKAYKPESEGTTLDGEGRDRVLGNRLEPITPTFVLPRRGEGIRALGRCRG
jgi:spermidine/putrescine-binding protein